MTVEYCQNFCRKKNYSLAAIRDGARCGCTNEPIDLHMETSRFYCNLECSGQVNSTGLCGGENKWTIYVLAAMDEEPGII